MRIAVCLRMGADGELGPFDAAALEMALRMPDAEVVPISMGPSRTGELLLRLTRLGAPKAYLLTDPAFAGADTLATAYVLSLAVKRLAADLVFCGRQTLVGDTAQTGLMLAEMTGLPVIGNAMALPEIESNVVRCVTREGERCATLPALVTFERICSLRKPSLRSKTGEVVTLSATDLAADISRCGLAGSPTRVISTTENQSGRRRCKFIGISELDGVIRSALESQEVRTIPQNGCEKRLSKILSIGEAPAALAGTVCETVTVLPVSNVTAIAAAIASEAPDAVLFGTDPQSRELAARLAVRMGLGLCADCTALESDGTSLLMIRPAAAGSVMAKVKCLTKPALATVRTARGDAAPMVVAAGYGARDALDRVAAFAKQYDAAQAASRRAVDAELLPYEHQVGLTGKAVSPAVYVAVGISGAVHHIVGMERSRVVIAVNPDKDAPIFDYADYGVLARAEDLPF